MKKLAIGKSRNSSSLLFKKIYKIPSVLVSRRYQKAESDCCEVVLMASHTSRALIIIVLSQSTTASRWSSEQVSAGKRDIGLHSADSHREVI